MADSLNYTVIVRCGPHQQAAARTAFEFTREVINQGHHLVRVFFYQQGVYLASSLRVAPQGELNLTSQWQKLNKDSGVELAVCIAGAIQSGIVDNAERERYDLDAANLASGFSLVGLGQLVSASVESDRLVSFGG